MSMRIRNTNFYGILRYKRITNLGQTTRPSDSKKKTKKKTCRLVEFAVPGDHTIKSKESEKRDKYPNLDR